MASCPYCSNPMSQYVCHTRTYWRCQSCYQSWPELTVRQYSRLAVSVAMGLSIAKPANS